MRKLVWLSAILLSSILCVASGPQDRQPTDPHSIDSASNPNARPVPVDDLYYSRRVFTPAWSPDGRELVFVTNFTGRFNLWKMNSDGGWPIQLLQADDRQDNPVWSPDTKSGTCMRFPRTAARR
jgi:WD40 repeat protein